MKTTIALLFGVLMLSLSASAQRGRTVRAHHGGGHYTTTTTVHHGPRYRAPADAARFEPLGEGRARVTFEEPQRALTPGQIAAFYDGPRVLGGAIFEEIDYDA